MPIAKSGSKAAFWANVKELTAKFIREGDSAEKAKKRAIAAAVRISREHGGDPNKWLGGGD